MRGLRCPVLVGRGHEFELLTDLLVAAGNAHGGVAFVLGEPGIGKSRLLAALTDVARTRQMNVLRGRAARSSVPAPYRPLAEAFLSLLRGRRVDMDGLEPFRAALPLLLPGSVPAEADAEPSMLLLGEATLALAGRCAGPGGALVVLDDLHWADAETCALIDYLSDKLSAEPIVLVASIRTGESSHAERLAHELTGRRDALSVLLRRLAADDVEQLVAMALGTTAFPESLRHAVVDASGGVPLLVEELLATLVAEGALWREGDGWSASEQLPALVPPSFATLVGDRLAMLGDRGRAALAAAAVIGDEIDPRLVAAIIGCDEAAAVEALREAVRVQLVDDVRPGAPRGFRFRHGLGRTAVLDLVSAPDRRQFAARALDALDVDGGVTGGERHVDVIADLAVAAGDRPRAVRLLVEAATAALEHGACASARQAAALAVEVATSTDQRADGLEILLHACVAAGDVASAADVGRELLDDLARLDAAPFRRAHAHLRLADAAVMASDAELAERHLSQATALTGELLEDRARVELLRASVALCRHRSADARNHASLAMRAAGETGDLVKLAEAAALLGRAERVTDVDAARRAFADAVAAARTHGNQILVAKTLHELATLDVLEGGPVGAMQEARQRAEATGALALVATCDAHLSILHWLHFELDVSHECATRALDAATRYKLGRLIPAAAVMVVGGDALLGRSSAVVEAFDRYLPLMDHEIEATERGHVLALLALAREDRAGAREQLDLAAALAPAFSDVARAPHCGMRALLLAVDAVGGASAVVEQLDRDPAIVGVPRALVDLATAVLEARLGDVTAAAPRVDRALGALRRTPWFHAMGARLVSEAAVADGWGRPVDWLRDAHHFFDHAGIDAPAGACRQLLRAAGAPAPRTPARGQHPDIARWGITPREEQVLALVADGRSNREIAEQLVLSVRTVEKHVERLMMKTATTNRTQLATVANRIGAAGTVP